MSGEEIHNDNIKSTNRLSLGEAYMICNECGAKLYSFDGDKDASRSCIYQKDTAGRCTDKLINGKIF